MTANQKEALRPYFHGITDERFEEMITEWPLNNISKGMNDYTLQVVEKAMKPERISDPRDDFEEGWSGCCRAIHRRIKRVLKDE